MHRVQVAAAVLLGLAASSARAAPKLVLVVSVDQMRADYLDKYGPRFRGAFKTLYEEGAVFTDAHHRHVPTETAPGHAAILTGRSPDRTGIVANDWWDRVTGKTLYSLADAVHGQGPENLEAYTLGDILKSRTPGSVVLSLSIKDRAAILMGGHKADAAIWFDKKKFEFTTSSYYRRPAWLAGFNAKLKEKGAPLAKPKEDLAESPLADRVLVDLLERVLLEYPLGEDADPDILAVSFSGPDYVGHAYGPDDKRMDEQMLRLDQGLGEFLKVLLTQVPRKDLAVVLTADHGVIPMPEGPTGKKRKLRRVLSEDIAVQAEKALQEFHPAPGEKWVAGFSFPHLYLNRPLAFRRGLNWTEFLARAAAIVGALDGLAQAYVAETLTTSEGLAPRGSPDAEIRAVYRRSVFPGRSGDIILRPAEGVLIAYDKIETTHGTPYADDSHVPLIFWGGDFRTRLFGSEVRVTDIAPTLAKVLGFDLPPEEGGRVLTEALQRP